MQTRDPVSAICNDNGMYFGEEDPQPELYASEGIGNVQFDYFSGFEKKLKEKIK